MVEVTRKKEPALSSRRTDYGGKRTLWFDFFPPSADGDIREGNEAMDYDNPALKDFDHSDGDDDHQWRAKHVHGRLDEWDYTRP